MRPPIVVDLQGPDGNIFALMGIAAKEINREEADEMLKEVQECKSYEDALRVIVKYVEIVDLSEVLERVYKVEQPSSSH